MSFSTIVIEEGQRNYIIQVTGTGPDDPPVVLVNVSSLNPPCAGVRLMRVSYDTGPDESVNLSFDGDANPFLTMTEGNGQTICYKKAGGIPNRNAGGTSNGDVLLGSAAGSYSLTLHFVKQGPEIPL